MNGNMISSLPGNLKAKYYNKKERSSRSFLLLPRAEGCANFYSRCVDVYSMTMLL
jgi:hypothetical protein